MKYLSYELITFNQIKIVAIMRIKMALSALALVFVFALNGQDTKMSSDISDKAAKVTEQMATDLNLTDIQVERVKGLNMSLFKNKDEIVNSGMPVDQQQEKFNYFVERHEQTLKQVLSEEQYEKFKSKYSDMLEIKK